MIAAVTGSSGFIGSHLVRRLAASGWSVRRLLRPDSPGRPVSGLRAAEGSQQARVALDGSPDAALDATLRDADVVVHLAGVTRARDDAGFHRGNVAPTEAIVRALERSGSQARLVLASSQAAAGPARDPHTPVRETDEPRPVEGYGRSKLAAERVALGRAAGETVVVRPTAVYGPGDRDFLALLRMARRGVSVIAGSADRRLDVVHVDDLLDGVVAAMTVPEAAGRTFFLGGEPTSWRELTAAAHHATRPTKGGPVAYVVIPDALVALLARLSDLVPRGDATPPLLTRHKVVLSAQPHWLCSSDAARATLAYAPSRGLPDGLRGTYLWYLENGWL